MTRDGRALAEFCDFSLFIRAPAETLRARLIGRKLAGGLSQAEAETFYERTDGPKCAPGAGK
ncbi:ATP/GTP-binding protein [Salmonella enterica subsp. enterica]|uniref:ATP/GTP-binding protein n=1 Tax=Salmonella enterica I TaxID=59201 RepID=A0A447N486_SALET|nr:ATP/GTP-binding protein [Salmonella enterica subsp. enterica]